MPRDPNDCAECARRSVFKIVTSIRTVHVWAEGARSASVAYLRQVGETIYFIERVY